MTPSVVKQIWPACATGTAIVSSINVIGQSPAVGKAKSGRQSVVLASSTGYTILGRQVDMHPTVAGSDYQNT